MYAAHGDVRPAGEVAYILKRYPRLSETFIVNEILALERRGVCLRILAAARPQEGLHHEMVEQVQAPVVYTRKKARRIWRSSPHRMWRQAGVSRKLGARLLEEAACCSDSSEAMEELAQALLVAAHVNGGRIVHLHAHFATSAARIACLASRLTGVPFSFTAHAKDIFMNSVDEKTLAGLLARASFVVAISSYHARFLQALQPEARLVKVTNGLDLSRFRAAPVASGLVEGKSSGAGASSLPLILGVGRLVEKKGFVGLMEACSLLKDRGVLFRCRIIGEGPERGRLEALISRRQLEPFCRLEGARTQEVVHRSLMEATVLAAPCVTLSSGDKDGLPTVILEAMAQGTPVVSTPVAAIPEIVEDHRTGLLVPEQDPSALAGRLESLLVHPRRCRRLARAARLALMERHDVNRSAARLAALFSSRRNLAGESAGAGPRAGRETRACR